MNRRSQAIIGATVIVLGIGVLALGFLEDESRVRYVNDLHSDPEGHRSGEWTLLGIPQPDRLAPQDQPNPAYENATTHVTRWADAEGSWITTTRLWVERNGTTLQWHSEIETRSTASSTPGDVRRAEWTQQWDGLVFQVEDFETGEKVWALFDGHLRDPIQPKPSQLRGALAADVPEHALIYVVEPDGFTVGCSSKFLPDDVAAEYDQDGDGRTD